MIPVSDIPTTWPTLDSAMSAANDVSALANVPAQENSAVKTAGKTNAGRANFHACRRASSPADKLAFPKKNRMLDALHGIVFAQKSDEGNAARLLLSELGKEAGGLPALYIEKPSMVKNLETDVEIKQGGIEKISGPFGKLLQTGGTLILNACDIRDRGQFAAFNTLMEEQSWKGKPIPCKLQNKKVEVRFLCGEDMLSVLSGAEISRASANFVNWRKYPIPATSDIEVTQPQESYPEGTVVIDLHHDANWRWRFFGGPEQDKDGQLFQAEGEISQDDFPELLVVRNPPDDTLLMNQLLEWQGRKKNILVEKGLPQSEIERNLACKSAAHNFVGVLNHYGYDAPVCIINNANISQMLRSHTSIENRRLVERPSFLQQTRENFRQDPVVWIAEELLPEQWDQLMHHPEQFSIAIASGLPVPQAYKHLVAAIPEPKQREFPLPCNIADVTTPVNFILSADPELTAKNWCNDSVRRLDVTPIMRSDEIIYKWKVDQKSASQENTSPSSVHVQQGLPDCRIQLHQLLQDLQAGEDVVIHNLEKNPELARHLATLTSPPYYLDVDGERMHYPGNLKGRLFIMTSDPKLVSKMPFSFAYTDESIGTKNRGRQWMETACDRLANQFSLDSNEDQNKKQVTRKVQQVLDFFAILRRHGLVQEAQPSYLVLENIFRLIFNAESSAADDPAQLKTRQFRVLFKSKLIGEFRQTGQYDQLKLWMKLAFRDEMSDMPEASVDTARLKELLERVNHPEDIRRNAWQFLNVFSPDIIESIIGDDRDGFRHDKQELEKIRRQVLSLVCDQARHHGIPVAPMILRAASLPETVPLTQHDRPSPLTQEQKTLGLAKSSLSRGGAVSLKGGPGTGKTFVMEQLAANKSDYRLHVAQEGTKSFAQTLEAWAKDDANDKAAILLIDEANLSGPENLALLRSGFADGTLYVNGERIKLSGRHEIVFTGNSDLLPGRTAQQVEKESFATIQFKPIATDILHAVLIKPLLDHATKTGPLQSILDADLAQRLGEQVAQIHTNVQHAFPGLNLSPRNLEEYATQVLCRLQKNGHPVNQNELDVVLARMALNVYGSALSKAECQPLAHWLQDHLNVSPQQMLPLVSTPDGSPDSKTDAEGAGLLDLMKKTTLADTPSTRKLFDQVNWWLDSQELRESFNHKADAQMSTLGQQGLLIEGPASRGKDAVVIEALKARGKVEGADFIHINADPNDLPGFLEKVTEARRKGQILIVSELNLLPSGILEGELNDLLTGHSDAPAAPGFKLIGTINHGYIGRENLSPALRGSRMHLITLDDYATEELLPIAQSLRDSLCGVRTEGQVIRSMLNPKVSDDKLQKLIDSHIKLNNRLERRGCPTEFWPRIRQLRDAIELLHNDSDMLPKEAFEKAYSIYEFIAATDNGLVIDKPQVVPTLSVPEQLQTALKLMHPRWLSLPEFVSDINLAGIGSPLAYDEDKHRFSYDPTCSPDALYFALFAMTKDGLPCTSAAPNKVEPVSFAPEEYISAVGNIPPSGTERYIGKIANAGAEIVYLENGTWRPGVGFHKHEPNPPVRTLPNDIGLPKASKTVMVRNVQTVRGHKAGGARRLYLETENGQRPAQVRMDGKAMDDLHCDINGRWYVDTPASVECGNNVSYGQVEDKPQKLIDLTVKKNIRLLPSDNPTLFSKINTLKERARDEPLDRHAIVAELHTIFKGTFFYSDSDAVALKDAYQTGDDKACRLFVKNGLGVCAEISMAFAAILEQEFDIPTLLCGGHVTDRNNNILRQGHQWVKYPANGKLHVVDPTLGIPRPSSEILASDAAAAQGHPLQSEYTSHTPQQAPDADSVQNEEQNADPESWIDGCRFNDDITDIQHIFENFSLSKIGFGRQSRRRIGEDYNAFSGTFDIKRAMEQNPEWFRNQALRVQEKKRSIYIETAPMFETDKEKISFIARMTRPVQMLVNSGNPVLLRNRRGDWVEINSGSDIRHLFYSTGDTDPMKVPPGENQLILDAPDASATFFERLELYYQAQLLDNIEKGCPSFNRKNVKEVKYFYIESLMDGIYRTQSEYSEYPIAETSNLNFPIRLNFPDQPIEITKNDFLAADEDSYLTDNDTLLSDKFDRLMEVRKYRNKDQLYSDIEDKRLLDKIDKQLVQGCDNASFAEKLRLARSLIEAAEEDSPSQMRWYIERMLELSKKFSTLTSEALGDMEEWWDKPLGIFVGNLVVLMQNRGHFMTHEMHQAILNALNNFPDECSTFYSLDSTVDAIEKLAKNPPAAWPPDFLSRLKSSLTRFYGEDFLQESAALRNEILATRRQHMQHPS